MHFTTFRHALSAPVASYLRFSLRKFSYLPNIRASNSVDFPSLHRASTSSAIAALESSQITSTSTTTSPIAPIKASTVSVAPTASIAAAIAKSPASLSSTAKGTAYETLAQNSLRRLGFNLTRVGGRSDKGIDLLGTWELPSCTLRAVVQCKALGRRVGPALIRELEGTLGQAPRVSEIGRAGADGRRIAGTVGVLVARGGATKGVREALKGSAVGLVWICLEEGSAEEEEAAGEEAEGDEAEGEEAEEKEKEAVVRQIVWNERVGNLTGGEMGVSMRYSGDPESKGKEVVLTWREKVLQLG